MTLGTAELYHSGETWQHVLKSLSPQNMVKWDEKLILVKEELKNQSMHLIFWGLH